MPSLTRLVRDVVGGNPSVLGAFVFDTEGRVEASSGTSEDLLSAAVAMFVPLRDVLERASASMGCGEMSSTLVQGTKASLGVTDIDGVRAVALLGAEGAPAGALLQDSAWIARQIREGAA